ncbi:MAG: DUF2269 domain-containing protein [Magnetococcales bacterium]|nr:DUF2269 domain-containing protein [Magnetococcales bacterium]
MNYLIVKYIHIISATLLFGTGLGTAFHMLNAHLSGDVRAIAVVCRGVVRADWIFTASAVAIQFVTGAWMMIHSEIPMNTGWIVRALMLYFFIGACWLPVVWLQIKMHELSEIAIASEGPLPPRYYRYFHIWFVLGMMAFPSVLVLFYLMIFKP